MTSPRRPTYRTTPASQPWHRDKANQDYEPRHRLHWWMPREQSVPAIRERHGRET